MKIKEEPIDVEDHETQLPHPNLICSFEDDGSRKLDSCNVSANDKQKCVSQANEVHKEQQSFRRIIVPASVQPQQIASVCSTISQAPSSLPASETWPGKYGFTVSFGPQEKNTKGVSWTYSKIKDKLYVGKDVPCPINFSANTILPDDVIIRVMALYTSPEQVSEIVHRCVNHSIEELQNGNVEAEHLVRCESSMATYHVDATTGRHSVVVPFENPSVGQQYSTYIYKFACFGSCAGGPNRRPLMLIFTLECGNQVIGRRKLDVKICACPGRDKRTEESQYLQANENFHMPLKRKEPDEFVNLSEILHFTKSVSYPPPKKTKVCPSRDGFYTVNVEDRGCYEFLLQMKKFYEMCKFMKNLSPDTIRALLHFQKKKIEKNDA